MQLLKTYSLSWCVMCYRVDFSNILNVLCFSKDDLFNLMYGPVGSNHGNLQNPPLLALGYRALQELPRCTVRG